MRCFSLQITALTILIALLAYLASFQACSARKTYTPPARTIRKAYSSRHSGGRKLMDDGYGVIPLKNADSSTTFNVLSFGAKGNGNADDTKAFEAAWAAACRVRGSTMVVPAGSVFLVKPISFSGNCESNIVFQLDGKIIAPTSSGDWGSGVSEWLEFSNLQGITITGKGTIDGQGSVWWNDSTDESESETPAAGDSLYRSSTQDLMGGELSSKMSSSKPAALKFSGSTEVTVTGITIQNSPKFHLKFDDCTGVQVSDFSVSSPGDSPNTDGIHLQNTRDAVISNTNLACGDDCVSIQTGCSNVLVHNVNCGPGHGISIGGLGNDNTKACVSNITVRDITIRDTMTGVRIKTWQGGSGSVSGVTFSNIQVSEVKKPIVIDQFYCDKSSCQNESAAVAVSDINYINIRGTYTETPVYFACSDHLPCSGVTLTTIQLEPAQKASRPFCWETYGELKTNTVPPIDCLLTGNPSNNKLHSNSDSC